MEKKVKLENKRRRHTGRVSFHEWKGILECICGPKIEKMKKQGYSPDFVDFSLRKWYDNLELTIYFVIEGVSPAKSTLLLPENYEFNTSNYMLSIKC